MRLYTTRPTITADDLKDQLTLQSPVYGDDGRGGKPIASWETVIEDMWCQVKGANGNRSLQEAQLTFNEAKIFRVRYPDDFVITADMRVVFQGKNFTIHAQDDIDNKFRYVEILAYTKDL